MEKLVVRLNCASMDVYYLAKKYGVEMPICEEIYKVLYEGKSAKAATVTLLSRTQKTE